MKMHILSLNQNVANQNHEDQFWERKNMTTKKQTFMIIKTEKH